MRGGGGGTSSNAGGANDGARRRCIGRGGGSSARSLGSWAKCAWGGRAKPPEPFVKLRLTALVGGSSASEHGEWPFELALLSAAAPGHPHSYSWAGGAGSEFGEVYAGR